MDAVSFAGRGNIFQFFSFWDIHRGDSSSPEFSGVGRSRNCWIGETSLGDLGYLT